MSTMSSLAAPWMVSRVKPETCGETLSPETLPPPLKCASTIARLAAPGLRTQPLALARLLIAVWLIPCFAAIAVTGSTPARYAASIATQSTPFF